MFVLVFGDSAILSICEFLVLGPLEPANHVWLRFRTDPVEYEEYGSEECRLDGVFATEVEARATAEDAAESDDVSDISCDCPNCYPLKPYYSYEKYMIKD